jgi:DNA-binding MarR family transcriptional regulator
VHVSYHALLLPRLVAIGELANRFISEAADRAGLNATQWLIGFHLDKNSSKGTRVPMSPKRLAALMMCPQTRVITQLATMRRKGLIEPVVFGPAMPHPSPSEGRKFYVLTAVGSKLIEKSVRESARGDQVLASLFSIKLAAEITHLHNRLEDASVEDLLDSVADLQAALRQRVVKRARQ